MNNVLGHPLLTALGYALLHSVWVFTILILAGQLTAKGLADAGKRHTVLLVTLASLLPAFALLVWWGMPGVAMTAPEAADGVGPFTGAIGSGGIDSATTIGWLPNALPALSVAYLVGLLISGLRTARAYGHILTMRRGTLLPDAELRGSFLALRRLIAPGSSAEWRLSPRVEEVLTVGVWRPLILFPLALVNALSPAEIDAILRHELAHLRRRDHFWQALQQCLATLFFYHPLVHWLCRTMDQEREFACDDIAVGPTGQKTYARALMRVATYSLHPKIPFTVPATDRSSFSHRLRRLFAHDASPRRSGGYLFAPLLSLPLLALLAFGPADGLPFFGPDAIITGTVVDEATGDPLIGTIVMIKETIAGTVTDINGNFRLEWNGESETTLVLNYVGYVSKEIIFDNVKDRDLNIQMRKQGSLPMFIPNAQSSSISKIPDNIIMVVDGRIIDGENVDLTPPEIAAVKVIKDKAEMAELGYDTEKEGVVLITTKKE
ncbi:M56 family metallopeptidase [Lewinella sp. IMCC34191]|uniref:M56 family metallopeptidase n=1 Tax=Lewinella sp. IMCC34191 TaxID=2259172 RepID=UPI0018E57D67|nr:M56 family metallopeptidase [Lewinella sp. IMCC34191]